MIVKHHAKGRFMRRSLRGDKLLLAVTRLGRSSLWSVGSPSFGVSGAGAKMGLRGHRVSARRLPGGYTLGSIGIHLHVDLRRSLSSYQVNVKIIPRDRYHPGNGITHSHYVN